MNHKTLFESNNYQVMVNHQLLAEVKESLHVLTEMN